MSAKNDGGSAFPIQYSTTRNGNRITFISDGMSLRDWFAGQALAGMLSSDGRPTGDQAKAEWAYDLADAMLKAREGGQHD